MRYAALFAAMLLTGAAQAGDYYVQSEPARACPHAEQLLKNAKACQTLPVNARVGWDGKIIDGFGPHYLGGNVARVSTAGRTLFVYANGLSEMPWRDPLQTDFVLTQATVACADPGKVTEGLTAAAHRDAHWLRAAGCVALAKGTPVIRIAPTVEKGESLWRVNVRFSQTLTADLWLPAAACR